MSDLKVQLLGPFQVWLEGQLLPPAAWPGRKARQLLKILITYRQRAVASEELTEWLWPELSPESARNSLWVAVSHLRRLLEEEATGRGTFRFILTEPPGYRFEPSDSCEIDVDAFLEWVHRGRLFQGEGSGAAAVDAYLAAEGLYRGDYLAEDLYEEWASATRAQLCATYMEMETALATCYLAQGRLRETLLHAQRVLDGDNCRESAWRLVMEAHYRSGEQDQALRAFERCRQTLARELGVDPLPETAALHERMLRTPLPHARPPATTPAPLVSISLPFVGREKEWSRLSYLLGQAMGGQGQIVLVTGEPGIGKTRLLEELAGLAAARGAQVLFGRCYELEQNMAYAPVIEALRPLLSGLPAPPPSCPPSQLAAVAELIPGLRRQWPDLPPYLPLPSDEERTRLLTSLAHVVLGCAHAEPVVLLLDDLHWSDLSTLQLAQYLARQAHDQPFLLVGAYRSTHVDPGHALASLRAQLSRQGTLTELVLPAFGEDDVVLLMRSLGSEASEDAFARRLCRETEGHPFFLAELLRTLAQEGLIQVGAQGRWHLVSGKAAHRQEQWPLPSNVQAAAHRRLDRLPQEDRALLELASVIGREFRLSLIALLLEQPETALVGQADQLSQRGFLRPRGIECYEFSHDLMRRAAYRSLSEPRRRLLHRRVAGALLSLPRPGEEGAGRIATHYAAGDRPWLALEYALTAAEQAARVIAYDEAIAWCRLAMEIAEAHPTSVPAGYRTRLHLQLRMLWYYRGDLERTLAADRAALAAARQEGNATAQLQALWHLAHDQTQVAAGGSSGAQAEALNLARGLQDPAALARSLARQGSDTGFLAAPAERTEALEMLEHAVRLARQVADPALLHHVLSELWGVGRLPRARMALEEALALVRQLGDRLEEVGTLAKLADLLARQGDLTAAVGYAQEGRVLAKQVESPTYGAWSQRALGQTLVALGRTEEGLKHLREAVETFEDHAWRAMLAGTLLRLAIALRMNGGHEEAIASLQRVFSLSQETHEIYEAAFSLALLSELQLLQGQTRAGCSALEEAELLVSRIGLPWHRGGTLVHLAASRLLLGEAGAALTTTEEALHLAYEEDLRELRAHSLWLRGRAQRTLGRSRDALAALEEGLAQAETIGHVWLHNHLKQEIASLTAE